jgi:tetratricopeptide (TPR) repeat protein
MGLTIEQTLQQAISAHKEGNLQKAERLYSAVLHSQPAHPDANHNLGLIAVSINKVELALSLFKTALGANPKIKQFWLSYMDALVKANQLETAKVVLQQARKMGLVGDRVDALEGEFQQITQPVIHKLSEKKKSLTLKEKRKKISESKQQKKRAKGKSADGVSPPQSQLDSLLEHYQNGQHDKAEKLAVLITQQFPNHQFSWKVLGILFQKTARKIEALNANQRAVQLGPQDAEAYNNLGNTLKGLGRLEEAEISYRQAIVLKLNFIQAHYNVGITLQELGRLEEAEVSYRQAISMKPDFGEAHYNLGITLQELGKLKEAEASCRQAIAIKPNYAEAHSNLGITLKKMGRLDEAKASFKQAIALKPDYAEAYNNLGIALQELGSFDEAESTYTKVIVLKPDYAEAHSNLGHLLQDLGGLDEAEVMYTRAIELKPDFSEAHNRLLQCLYLLDKQSLFFDKLDYLIDKNTANATIGSLTCRSALKYGVEKPNLFCREPLQYVLHIDMNTRYDFEEIFVEKVRLILNEERISNRRQALLVNGSQTSGNLFDIKNSFTEQIQKAIRLEIEKYRINFKDSKDGLIKKWPTEYSLYGWLISMKSGGELKPHIHDNGWLSGSLYINVPPKSKADSGNLVVSLGQETDATDTRINEKKIINVVTGSLVLFPASLTHCTIPFEAEEERIVLAFDVKPKYS